MLQLVSDVPDQAIADFFLNHKINSLICYGDINLQKIESIAFESLLSLSLDGYITNDSYFLILNRLIFNKIVNLRLRRTPFNCPEYWERVSDLIKNCTSLKYLQVTEDGVEMIAEALKVNTTLASLNLSDCIIKLESFELIVSALKERPKKLEYLNLKEIREFNFNANNSFEKDAMISRLKNVVDKLEY